MATATDPSSLVPTVDHSPAEIEVVDEPSRLYNELIKTERRARSVMKRIARDTRLLQDLHAERADIVRQYSEALKG